MSYWNEIEPVRGNFDFKELDRQIEVISKNKGTITLCLGVRQPRWPENHWPEWAWNLPEAERSEALLKYIESVVERYKNRSVINSYQLENEALLKSFGERSEVNRRRLRREYKHVRYLDRERPLIMTTSTSWGIPIRRPIPDTVGFSYYQVLYNNKKQSYSTAFHKPWLHKLRSVLISIFWSRPSIIHELQLEPWGPKAIWEMPYEEQMKSMSPGQIEKNIRYAKATGLTPIDLWGGEWWYWCQKHLGKPEIIKTVMKEIRGSS